MLRSHFFWGLFTILAVLTTGADRSLAVAAQGPRTAEAKGAAIDQQGDPLPDGAVARMGSLRWRHGDTVVFVAFAPDNMSVLTASMDKVVRLWDRATGKEVRRFTAAAPAPAPGQAMDYFTRFHIGAGRTALSSDGKLCAAVRPGDIIQVWNVATGESYAQIRAPSEGANAIVFSPDGKALAVRGTDRGIHLLDVPTGKEIRVCRFRKGGVGQVVNSGGTSNDHAAVMFSPDGKNIAAAEAESINQKTSVYVRIIDTNSGAELRRLPGSGNGVEALAYATSGKLLAFACRDAVYVRDPETGKKICDIPNEKQNHGVGTLRFTPDGKTLLGKCRDGAIRVWDAATGEKIRELQPWARMKQPLGSSAPFAPEGNDLAVSPDGKVVAATAGSVLCLWDLETGKAAQAAGHGSGVSALAFADDGKTLISRGGDGAVIRWHAASGKEAGRFHEPPGVICTSFTRDGQIAAMMGIGSTIYVHEVATGKQLQEIARKPGWGGPLAISPDGKVLATRATKPSEPIFLYNAATGAETKVIATPVEDPGPKYRSFPDPARPVALAPDSRLVAVYSPPRHPAYSQVIPAEMPLSVIHLIDVGTGKRTAQIAAPKRTIVKLAFSPDGRVLAAENADETITLYEVVSGQERATVGKEAPPDKSVLPGHLPPPNWNPDGFSQPTALLSTIAFSADSAALAARGPDNTVRVWNVVQLEELGILKGHHRPVLSVAFSPGGTTLMSGSADTTILAWDIARLKRRPTKAPALRPSDAQSCWADLASSDARLAFRSMQRLIAVPEAAVPILREQLKPAPPADPTKLDRWLADLDNENFKTRTVAVGELEKLGDVALPALEKALASRPTLESRRRLEALVESLATGRVKAEQVRAVRAIEVLERTGTANARNILESLAKGAPGALSTRHAEAALGRMHDGPAGH